MIILTLFTLGVTLIGNQSYPLIVTYGKGIELKANYHIVLHSVAGACVMLHIFKTFEKPPKSIKVTPFHGKGEVIGISFRVILRCYL